MGAGDDERLTTSTELREMYFLKFARDIATMPIMVTGGVTKLVTAQDALKDDSVQVIGIASALAQNPNLPNDWETGKNLTIDLPLVKLKNRNKKSLFRTMITRAHMRRMGAGKMPRKTNPVLAILQHLRVEKKQLKRYRRWLSER